MGDEEKKADSVYDFLYVDHDRIGLLLSQFGTDGLLTEIVRQSESSDEANSGIDIKIVKFGSSEGAKESLNKRFNARWLLPLLFLDSFKDRIRRDLTAAPIGSLVLSAGLLGLLNTDLLQRLYRTDALKKLAFKKAISAANESGAAFDHEAAELELEAVTSVDAQIQMHLFRPDSPRIWSTLRSDYLVTPASELNLKHGNIIGGEHWNVLGILDGHPFDVTGSEETDQTLSGRFEGQPFLQEAVQITGGLRRSFGRSTDAAAVTTLIIFREVS